MVADRAQADVFEKLGSVVGEKAFVRRRHDSALCNSSKQALC